MIADDLRIRWQIECDHVKRTAERLAQQQPYTWEHGYWRGIHDTHLSMVVALGEILGVLTPVFWCEEEKRWLQA